jgi:hypothetical protein
MIIPRMTLTLSLKSVLILAVCVSVSLLVLVKLLYLMIRKGYSPYWTDIPMSLIPFFCSLTFAFFLPCYCTMINVVGSLPFAI